MAMTIVETRAITGGVDTHLDVHVAAPDPVEQLGAAVHALRVAEQEAQQPELGCAELDLAAVSGDAVRRRVESQRADLDRRRLVLY